MAKRMRALAEPLVGASAVASHRSAALSGALVEWADVLIGFQPSHLEQMRVRTAVKPVLSLATWLGLSRIADPNFDSTGVLQQQVLAQIQEALPLIYRDVTGQSW